MIKLQAYDAATNSIHTQGDESLLQFLHQHGDKPLMRFTQLQDAYQNDLYEHDIVVVPIKGFEPLVCVIKFVVPPYDDDCTGWYVKSAKHEHYLFNNHVAKIGNKYTNPELIEQCR